MHIIIKDHNLAEDYDTKKYLDRTKDGKYILKPYKRQRTISQNSYLWGGIYGIIEESTAQDKDTIHAEMSYKFLLDNSGKFPRVKSTKDLSTLEFGEYIDRVILFRGEFDGLSFPTVEEYKNSSQFR